MIIDMEDKLICLGNWSFVCFLIHNVYKSEH